MIEKGRALRRPRGAALAGILAVAWVFVATRASAKTFLYEGQMASEVRVVVEESYTPDRSASSIIIKSGRFPSFAHSVNKQSIAGWKRTFDPPPTSVEQKRDSRGNLYDEATWKKPSGRIVCRTEFTAALATDFGGLASTAPWPPSPAGLADEAKAYLGDSDMLEQKQARVGDLARKLTAGSRNQHEAVIRVMNYAVDNLRYVLNPGKYSAGYALDTGTGNCQNYAHLVCALLHTQGVAARVVNGLSLNRPWKVPTDNGTLTLDSALARHAWVEVFYPDLGWVSFDPQMSHYFVSTHLIKQAVGVDSPEISDYFLITGGRAERVERIDPTFGAEQNGFRLAQVFQQPQGLIVTGTVRAAAAVLSVPEVTVEGPARPKPLLVTDGLGGSSQASMDRIKGTQAPEKRPPPSIEPPLISRAQPSPTPAATKPVVMPTPAPTPAILRVAPSPTPTPTGPTPVPAPVRTPVPTTSPTPWMPTPSPSPTAPLTPPPTLGPSPSPTATRPPVSVGRTPSPEQFASLTRLAEIGLLDILVAPPDCEPDKPCPVGTQEEAAQYVTDKEEFAQRFEVRDAMVLFDVNLALYKFEDSAGELWAEIRDDVNGLPSPEIRRTSVRRPIRTITSVPHYEWVAFNFRDPESPAYLPPGKYWIVLKFRDAIFNWHCRIGNPYLDPDDVRSRRVGSTVWDNQLNIDFNFFVTGMY